MSVVVSDLVARVRAEGVEQTAQQVKAVGDAATQTARALEIMAQTAAKQGGGTQQGWMEIFTKGNVQPTAAAMAQAAQEMQRMAAATAQAAAPAQNVARAAVEHATAARSGAQAAQSVADGWKVSESSVVRFGTALVGINLGISLIAGAARLIHDTIAQTVTAQLDWERSLVQVRAIYGDIAPRVVALSQAQAAMPGVTTTQQQLLQANIAAGFLTTRYGVSPSLPGTLTTQAARLGGLLYPDDQQQQAGLQGAFLQYAQSGGSSLQGVLGLPGDPSYIANRLGFRSAAALQALTPQQIVEAQTNIAVAAAAQANIQGGAEGQQGLLSRQRDLQHNLEQAQAQVQNALENIGAPQPEPDAYGRTPLGAMTNFPVLGTGRAMYPGNSLINVPPEDVPRVAAEQQAARETQRIDEYQRAVDDAQRALAENSGAIADNQRQLEQANEALAKFGVEAGSATARLLSFTGSLEDTFSIARGDVSAQAQAAVAARGRSAIPSIGTPSAEIAYQATQTAYQQAYQNFVAEQAQSQGDNAIRDYLGRQANQQGPGLDTQRSAAQRALDQAQQAQPIQQAMGEAQRAQSQIDLAAAERQAQLDQINLTQRERYVQLMQQTVELRLQDNSLQQDAIRASSDVIRAQQAVLPAERTASAAQYQQNLAQAYARQRMGRLLQGRDVSDLPSLDQLITMRYQGQLAEAENGVALVQGERGVQVQQQNATSISLQDTLVQNNVRLAELQVDAENLRDIPRQTQYELELVQINRDQISVQTEMREYLKALVWIMTNQPPSGNAPAGGGGPSAPLSPPDLPGNRRGPF